MEDTDSSAARQLQNIPWVWQHKKQGKGTLLNREPFIGSKMKLKGTFKMKLRLWVLTAS